MISYLQTTSSGIFILEYYIYKAPTLDQCSINSSHLYHIYLLNQTNLFSNHSRDESNFHNHIPSNPHHTFLYLNAVLSTIALATAFLRQGQSI
jgi:hypothetical protein